LVSVSLVCKTAGADLDEGSPMFTGAAAAVAVNELNSFTDFGG